MNDRYILAAEDDAATSKVLWYALTNAGYSVTNVVNGVEAWEAAQLIQFDLIITDYQMPELNGRELCELLRRSEWYSGTPIILLTAKCLELDVRQLQDDYDLRAVFRKPFSPKDLVRAVEQCFPALNLNQSIAPCNFLTADSFPASPIPSPDCTS
ncbi:MAG: response regulator [Planctomycetaceae bacterium]|nr:response regulator [Planctomycetales bacterium]MCB9927407.1 response regulator [Planctomycetaceae bacterium]